MTATIQPALLDVPPAKKRVKRRPKRVVDASAPVEYATGVDASGNQTWTLRLPAPDRMISANSREYWRKLRPVSKAWREAAYLHAKAAKLPTGLRYVRIDIVLRFPTAAKHDSANYYSNVGKPWTDGWGPAVTQVIKKGPQAGTTVVSVGYGLIPDDTPEFLDGPFITVGPKVDDPKRCPFGEVVVTITDLSHNATN